MSTLSVATIKSQNTLPPAVQNSSGTEIGTFCRAWVNFNGTGTVAIRASFNVTSITDNGTGNYAVNFTTAMSDADYAAAVTGTVDFSNTSFQYFAGIGASSGTPSTKTTTQLGVVSLSFSGSFTDSQQMNITIFR